LNNLEVSWILLEEESTYRKQELQWQGIDLFEDKIKNLDRIVIIGCGTSWHAGLVGEYLFEDIARIPCEVEYASEFRYLQSCCERKVIL
jgi:glucosamine--fructose-6-phosphate aminotransferase (isomerizing)